jgi:hypothetical protein
MRHPESNWPFEEPEQLAEALREQGATPEELADLLPNVRRLSEWPAPEPSLTDTQLLLAKLARTLPAPAPVRQAIHAHRQRQGSGLRWLLATARTQVSLFGPAFWLLSALVTLVGAAAVLSNVQTDQDVMVQELMLRACGPFLAFLGASIAFRGRRERVLEFELVCLPSPVQLAIARLVIVLGYDVGLGFALSLALWVGGAGQILALTLSWFMPLLLVAGLALLLSLRLSVQAAAALAYGSWLAVLVLNATSSLQLLSLTPLSQTVLGGIGVALLCIALLRLRTDLRRLLPSP